MVFAWKKKKKKGKTSKFVDAGRNNWMREKGINSMKWIDWAEKKNKIKNLDADRCENILYTNK